MGVETRQTGIPPQDLLQIAAVCYYGEQGTK